MAMINKPKVIGKLHQYMRKVRKNNNQVGTIPRSIGFQYNNICNFKCEFCFTAEEGNAHIKECLDFETIKRVSDEADALGIWEVVLSGGELLVDMEKLIKLIEAVGADRFQMVLITNGYLMNQEVADLLAEKGIDCIGVSISGMNPDEHNRSRGGVRDAHQRALSALDYAYQAGMNAWPNVIFGHHNAKDPDLYAILDYAKEKGYSTYFMMAMPFGVWKDNIMTAEDLQILAAIRQKYDVHFDTWDMYDPKRERISGCWTVNRTVVSPLGDVLVCPYINIKIGNVKEQSLSEILDYGFSIKYFGEYSPICISAHNRVFRDKFMPDEGNVYSAYDAHEIFGEEDYIENVKE